MPRIPTRYWALMLVSALLQTLPFPLASQAASSQRSFCWICLAPLLFCLSQGEKNGRGKALPLKQGLLLGYACGVIWYLTTCYWVYATMHHYGGLPTLAAAGVLLLFSMYLGLYHALFAGLFTYLRARTGPRAALLVSPFLWVAVELLRARVTGFPWDLLGYTQVDNLWINRLAVVTGTMGLSFLVAAVNALWVIGFFPGRINGPAKNRLIGPALALAVLLAVEIAGITFQPPADKANRAGVLLQDNLSVGEERRPFQETKSSLLQDFTRLSLAPVRAERLATGELQYRPAAQNGPPEMIAWAEAPTSFFSADPEFRQAAGLLARRAQAPVVADAASAEQPVSMEARPKEFVSAAFFDRQGTYVGRYDKMHLVPFGEYVPYKPLFFFAGHLLDGLDFSPGTERRVMKSQDHTFGVFICYESVFGTEVREFAKAGAQVFVNLSDDGWYGDTSAPWEHLDMVRMRAVENGRWVLRATNTGVTGSIDTRGRVVSRLPRHVRAALLAPFEYRDELTFYTRYGDWFGWLCLLVVSGALLFAWLAPAHLRQRAVA